MAVQFLVITTPITSVQQESFSKLYLCRPSWSRCNEIRPRPAFAENQIEGNFFDGCTLFVDLTSMQKADAAMSLNYDVLVVDDRMLYAQETLVALDQVAPRAAVLHLDSSREALAYLFSVREFAGRPSIMPQLVLLSAEMSDISGLCVLDLMRAHPATRNIPIVVLSLGSNLLESRQDDSFGADAYVTRPCDFQRYCAVMEAAVRCWLPWALRPSSCDSWSQRAAHAVAGLSMSSAPA